MSAATYDRTIRQGNTEPFRINFIQSEIAQAGKTVTFSAKAQFVTGAVTKTATLGVVVLGDAGYDADVDKWFAAWELSFEETRGMEAGDWPYEIEVWDGDSQSTYIDGTLTVEAGVNTDE